ncbi:acetyl-CoA acetyltransferase [Nocardia seriolae]|uniref:Acetyl-CoA acetyltransferase n=1 Tax=Nocardia seriolae TaxID=37332 RepID=A0ABC9Z3K8_9NOCA|nr:acetyl-CoA acetyltransferase [Nocardia seriolae]GAP32163.1 acetyl-CoA acetyltransferase [Nocardia seriolae]GEM27776.1 hypothetical protein NS2_60150 [Nocardia seriolae NBRC 15557]
MFMPLTQVRGLLVYRVPVSPVTLASALILGAVICRREKSDGQATLAPTAVACTERPDSLLTQTFAPVCGSPLSSVRTPGSAVTTPSLEKESR